MPAQITLKRDEKNDVVTAEILAKSRFGVVQIRAVAPLAPIRAKLQALMNAKGGSMSGCNCDKAAVKVAGVNLLRGIALTARAPLRQRREGKRAKSTRCHQIAQLAMSGELERYGGFPGLAASMCQRRRAQCAARMAKGMPRDVAKKLAQKEIANDVDNLHRAAAMAGVQIDGDAIGFSIFHALKKAGGMAVNLNPMTLQAKAAMHMLRRKKRGGGNRPAGNRSDENGPEDEAAPEGSESSEQEPSDDKPTKQEG